MRTVLITGSAGLIGAESVIFFHKKGFRIVGIDNNRQSCFFGPNVTTEGMILKNKFTSNTEIISKI